MQLPRRFLTRALLVIGGSAALYAGLVLALGWRDIAREIAAFPPGPLALLAGLSLANYGLRFWRWEFYLRELGVRLPLRTSAILYFSAYVMVVTPGKIGEIFKAGILQDRFGVALARGIPVVLAERIYDFVAVLLLAVVGIAFWPGPLTGLATGLAGAGVLALFLILCQQPRLRGKLLAKAGRHPLLANRGWAWEDSLAALDRLLGVRLSSFSVGVSAAAWFCECLGLWLVCREVGHAVPLPQSVFIYATGTLVGSLFFLPGGLGGTEATIIWMLSTLGFSATGAATVALVVRLMTLWLAMVIGLVCFLAFRSLLLGPPARGSAPPSHPVDSV